MLFLLHHVKMSAAKEPGVKTQTFFGWTVTLTTCHTVNSALQQRYIKSCSIYPPVVLFPKCYSNDTAESSVAQSVALWDGRPPNIFHDLQSCGTAWHYCHLACQCCLLNLVPKWRGDPSVSLTLGHYRQLNVLMAWLMQWYSPVGWPRTHTHMHEVIPAFSLTHSVIQSQ